MGQVVQGLWGCGEDLGFYPKGGGSPGGLWAAEGLDPTWVLTSDLWRRLEGQGARTPGKRPLQRSL